MTPAERIALVLGTNEKSALAYCRQVQSFCKEFRLSPAAIAEYLERNPGLKSDPRLMAEKIAAPALREIQRVARILGSDNARAMRFCGAVQKAFKDRTISLKTIADCAEQISGMKVTQQLVIRRLGGPRELSDYDGPPKRRKGSRYRGGLGVSRGDPMIERIKRETGDWETD